MSKELVQAATVSGPKPLVRKSAAQSAAYNCTLRRASRLSAGPDSARSTRPRHSSVSDKCTHSGTAAMVRATPISAAPVGAKAPIQSRAHLSDLTAIARLPGGRGQCLHRYFGSVKEIPVIVGMASRHLFELAAFSELLEGVGACGLVQPMVRDHASGLRRRQRLRDEVGQGADRFRCAISPPAAIKLAASTVKSPAKTASRRNT